MALALRRRSRDGVTLIGNVHDRMRFGFTERTGGVSAPPFASLNLSACVGDDEQAVAENRSRVLAALGAQNLSERLLVPNQVHGDHIVSISSSAADDLAAARAEISRGADAIVCAAPDVPVMLCFADCVPVVLVCRGAFAVVHSGWKGTYARIAGKAVGALLRAASADASEVSAYIGPHILGDEYEVSQELHIRFQREFANMGTSAKRTLDLGRAISQTLEEAGVTPCAIHDPHLSTVRLNSRFYSYRREHGCCGRHAAVAVLLS
ncbi:protein of unknown function DUF152 [Coriobacterium glomerans PW2]|uniref:Laccase domain-containing protein n=1 Tax=Coriobacterium glomerans (strain ATCC 49209 / DSM 20642 / JCM 10262 / PW2) TaxID=700015 RepID=F2NBS2_CORGP|nr:polyphenol oxidase family protein [Coriobacterium glomerans]AEB06881.1 protein of unknown function DUF152 [Coriobacterium glomerans PW2]